MWHYNFLLILGFIMLGFMWYCNKKGKLRDKAIFRFYDFNRATTVILMREFGNFHRGDFSKLNNIFEANELYIEKYKHFKISLFTIRRFRREVEQDRKDTQDRLNKLEKHFGRSGS